MEVDGCEVPLEVNRPTIVFAATALVSPRKDDDENSNSSGGSGGEGDGRRKRKRSRGYNPSAQSRRSHNETERRRRYRMKKSCEVLRKIVPGLDDKTDKAKVLEYAVDFLQHLVKCPANKCDDYEVPDLEPVTRVNLLQPVRNREMPTMDTMAHSSRIVQIEFVTDQQQPQAMDESDVVEAAMYEVKDEGDQ